jgi:hypothetical protein
LTAKDCKKNPIIGDSALEAIYLDCTEVGILGLRDLARFGVSNIDHGKARVSGVS